MNQIQIDASADLLMAEHSVRRAKATASTLRFLASMEDDDIKRAGYLNDADAYEVRAKYSEKYCEKLREKIGAAA